ncbi:hypothetical protein PCC7424_0680 [Gloeothece citriformis PCC 7424]|uniref:Uncharacterized protein n=1 Tax=Gloeothece citriformis (strain PCC 7424) TaxID=65393 RepID=B7KFU5_GLOC7|nr:hypothetical protein [Gloeothece citriformis]ACK69138.1 hypothetical protein PCC7424_0680 [Gloeothece citriformis PCC 7424]
MIESTQDTTLAQATILLSRYGFEMKGYIPQELIDKWLNLYPAKWIRAAIIEALYQGRYKAISVEQILKLWSRRQQMTCHFTHEFERLICRNLIKSIDSNKESSAVISQEPKTSERKIQRKSFNPPINEQPNSLFTPELEELKGEEQLGDQWEYNQSKDLNRENNLPITHQTFNASEGNNESFSTNFSPKNESTLTLLARQNQLTKNDDEGSLSSINTEVNHPQDIKVTLTNLEELFTHFMTEIDSKKSEQSIDNTDEDYSYQWGRLMARRTIDEFTPQLDRSELYSKLKAVVQQESD